MSKNVVVEAVHTLRDAIEADQTGFIRESVLLQLGGSAASNGAAPARKRAGRPRKEDTEESEEAAEETPRTSRRKRAKAKAPAVEEGGSVSKRILSFVRKNPNSSSSAIAEALGSTSTELRPEINALLESKELRKKGQKRGTTYSVRA